jgi:hypothetical protein
MMILIAARAVIFTSYEENLSALKCFIPVLFYFFSKLLLIYCRIVNYLNFR